MTNGRIGNVEWVCELTCFSKATVIRMVDRKLIPGAYQAFPGARRSPILFTKARVTSWFDALTDALTNAPTLLSLKPDGIPTHCSVEKPDLGLVSRGPVLFSETNDIIIIHEDTSSMGGWPEMLCRTDKRPIEKKI